MPDQPPDGPVRDTGRDSIRNTLLVAVGLSLVCSVLVAGTAVILKPVQ
jgi:Na+-transporting NADH:ubiquinone oxidoreductase subunit NqrC